MFDETNFNSVWNGNMLHYTLNLLASKMGLRLGEVQALRKENIFEDHLLINHGYVEKFGLQDTKNHKARFITFHSWRHFANSNLINSGIPKRNLSFHSWRHTFASNLANDNVPELYIRRLTGHSSTQILDVYSHIQVEKLRTAINV